MCLEALCLPGFFQVERQESKVDHAKENDDKPSCNPRFPDSESHERRDDGTARNGGYHHARDVVRLLRPFLQGERIDNGEYRRGSM